MRTHPKALLHNLVSCLAVCLRRELPSKEPELKLNVILGQQLHVTQTSVPLLSNRVGRAPTV